MLPPVHVANKAAIHQPETSSEESESDDSDEPGEVMLTHPTALSFSFPHNHMLEQVAKAAVPVPPSEVRSVPSKPQCPKLSMVPPGPT
jgi:hypothetical protein